MRVRVIVSYCLIVYALSWPLQFAAIHSVGNLEGNAAKPWLASGMFIPALAALLFAWRSPSARAALRWKATWRMLPMFVFAVAVPTAVAFGTVAVCEIAGWGKSGWFAFAQDGVTISGRPWILGGGSQSWPKFLANVAATGFSYAAISGLVAMGEELGWRGFLQGALIARLGTTRGIVLLGLIWSFWHLPILLAGYNYPDYPLLGAFVLFPVTLAAFSFFLGWLTLKANTFWPAALAHGAFNSIEAGIINNLHMTVPHIYQDLSNLGITVLVGLLYGTLLARREDARTEFRFHAATT